METEDRGPGTWQMKHRLLQSQSQNYKEMKPKNDAFTNWQKER